MIDISWFLWAEHPPCFPEVNRIASGCDEHQENLITGNNRKDHETQLAGVSPDVWPTALLIMVKKWKLMPLTLSVLKDELNGLYCTFYCLAQGAGWGDVQFRLTLHSVTASSTQQQIFPRYLITRNPEKLVLLPDKKKELNGNSFLCFNWKNSCQ